MESRERSHEPDRRHVLASLAYAICLCAGVALAGNAQVAGGRAQNERAEREVPVFRAVMEHEHWSLEGTCVPKSADDFVLMQKDFGKVGRIQLTWRERVDRLPMGDVRLSDETREAFAHASEDTSPHPSGPWKDAGFKLTGACTPHVSFSHVGFNRDRTQALVYAEMSCGGQCGYGVVYFLARADGGWMVVGSSRLWVA